MRLLNAHDLTFREFLGKNIPEYAIVSHRWDEDELSYQTFLQEKHRYQNGELRGYGWTKIKEAVEVTRQLELEWLWIDTVCINKDSSAELTESINSMYIWYSNCRICLVFLPDVHNTDSCTCELSDRSIHESHPGDVFRTLFLSDVPEVSPSI